MTAQIRAILWAQRRALLHHLRRSGKAGSIVSGLILLGWYGGWVALSVLAGSLAAGPASEGYLETFLPRGLLMMALYWQAAPLLLASQGASLDLKKLLVYPIPPGQLFGLEVLLRVSTCGEMLLLVSGLAVGLVLNPAIQVKSAPAGLGIFVLFNLLLSAGLRYQLERWLSRRRLRELLVLLLVLAAALPQLLMIVHLPARLRGAAGVLWGSWWPWSAAAGLALGRPPASAWAAVLLWTAAAWWYGRRQFRRGLGLETVAEQVGSRPPGSSGSKLDMLYGLPSRFLSDPLAGIVEKEIRSLVRSGRFRLVFVMGFTFGVLIFLPLMLRNRSSGGEAPSYALALLCGYALLLLGDVIFWNIFGMDRAAVQLYFLQPVSLLSVVAGKNLVAGIFVLLEITGIVIVWTLLRLPLSVGRIAEAYLAPAVLCVYMMAAGNLTSVYAPRAVSPERSTGAGSAAVVRVLLLLLMPALSVPVLLAYGARYAFGSQAAFYGVLALDALAGAAFYRFALEMAVSKAGERKEKLVAALSASEGPVRLG
jgi:ABC-2 type transport system permease protein